MVLTINYPTDETAWYAKGTLGDGTYFEVPAVFNPYGACDEAATYAKIEQFIRILSESP